MRNCVFVLALLTCLACQSATGTLTIINNHEKVLRGSVGDEGFSIKPQSSQNHELKVGEHALTFAGQNSQTVNIEESRTQVFDPHNPGCYAVADYRQQYGEGDGSVKIVEVFNQKDKFSPKIQLAVAYNQPLPRKMPEGLPVTRLQAVTCADIKNKDKLARAVLRLK